MVQIYRGRHDGSLKAAFSVLSVGTGHTFLMIPWYRYLIFFCLAAFSACLTSGVAALPGARLDRPQPANVVGAASVGDSDDDQDDVLRAQQSGNLLPFAVLLNLAKAKIDGEIIATQFRHVGPETAYVFKFIDKQGHVGELAIDAHTGAPLATTGE